jgi:hypothetical protein
MGISTACHQDFTGSEHFIMLLPGTYLVAMWKRRGPLTLHRPGTSSQVACWPLSAWWHPVRYCLDIYPVTTLEDSGLAALQGPLANMVGV